MLHRVLVSLVAILLAVPAYAQSATIAVFAATATDPNTATPIVPPTVYAAPACNQPLGTEATPPIVNPSTGFWVDPQNATRECRVTLSAQLAALPAGGPYRGAVKLGTGLYGPLSTAFTLAAAQAHPCDGTAPTTGTAVEGTRTIGWCHNGLDTNGTATTITSWRVYIDNVLAATILPAAVTVGATANAAGLRFHQATVSLTRGTRAIQMSAVNATGEAARSIVFTATITAPAAAPSTLQIREIAQ